VISGPWPSLGPSCVAALTDQESGRKEVRKLSRGFWGDDAQQGYSLRQAVTQVKPAIADSPVSA